MFITSILLKDYHIRIAISSTILLFRSIFPNHTKKDLFQCSIDFFRFPFLYSLSPLLSSHTGIQIGKKIKLKKIVIHKYSTTLACFKVRLAIALLANNGRPFIVQPLKRFIGIYRVKM